jgi:inorganic pyrophosphatase
MARLPLRSLLDLPARDPASGLVNVVVETPRGHRSKLAYDETLGVFRLKKLLPLGAAFPYDFGFVPSTRAEDGDPLDVLVLTDEGLFPGSLVAVRLIGVIEAEQVETRTRTRNDRLLGCIQTPYNEPEVRSIGELHEDRLAEIEHFFVSYNEAEGRRFEPRERSGPERALEILRAGMRRFESEGV